MFLRTHVGVIVQRLGGGPPVAYRSPAAFGELLQQLVASGFTVECLRHVLDHRHVAREPLRRARFRTFLRVASAVAPRLGYRRNENAQQAAGLGCRHKVTVSQPSGIDVLESIGDQMPIKNAIDRPAQTQCHHALARRTREQSTGAPVVEQNPAVRIADDDALRELRHEHGKAIALGLGRRIGGADSRADILFFRLTLLGNTIDGGNQGLQFTAALDGQSGRRLFEHGTGFFRRPRRQQHQKLVSGPQHEKQKSAGNKDNHQHGAEAAL